MSGGYIEQALPFQGATPVSRHTSAEGARDAAPRAGRQTRAYLRLLQARGDAGLTDIESARLMGVERSTVNARRGPLCAGDEPWVVPVGTRRGPTGVANCVWVLSRAGRRAVEQMEESEKKA